MLRRKHKPSVQAGDCIPACCDEEAQQLTKCAFARKLKTSRSQLDRLLDPENTKVTLDGLSRAAQAVGRELQLELR